MITCEIDGIVDIPDIYSGGVFLGIVLPAGAKKSATAFKYFDGSNPNPLTWMPGRPSNSTALNLVYCDKNRLGCELD